MALGLSLAFTDVWTIASAPDTAEDPPYSTYDEHPDGFVNVGSTAMTVSYVYAEFPHPGNVRGSTATPPWTANYATLKEDSWSSEIPSGTYSLAARSSLSIRRPIVKNGGQEAWWLFRDGSALYSESRTRMVWSEEGDLVFLVKGIRG